MPGVSPASLRGYVLEEVLAYLIRSSGYTLLVSPKQDPEALDWRGNGLVVKGRGARHQVDVLGELDWTPAFTFPLRLFLEAKFHEEKAGLLYVRNAVAVLADLNQRYVPTPRGSNIRRFRYAYALVSTSGFTRPAIDMAFAHEISLVDFQGPGYQPLIRAITDAVEKVLVVAQERIWPWEQDADGDSEDQPSLVARVRSTLRSRLDTDPWVEDTPLPSDERIGPLLAPVVESAREVGNLFVGMASGPYMLLLQAAPRDAFVRRMLANPVLGIDIHWNTNDASGMSWTIRPRESERDFRLTFRLPDLIGKWIFSDEEGASSRARRWKRTALPHIFIPFKDERGADHLFRLDYLEPPQS